MIWLGLGKRLETLTWIWRGTQEVKSHHLYLYFLSTCFILHFRSSYYLTENSFDNHSIYMEGDKLFLSVSILNSSERIVIGQFCANHSPSNPQIQSTVAKLKWRLGRLYHTNRPLVLPPREWDGEDTCLGKVSWPLVLTKAHDWCWLTCLLVLGLLCICFLDKYTNEHNQLKVKL